MTAIIKARATDVLVRALPPSAETSVAIETPQSRAEAELAAARCEITDLRAALARARSDSETAVKRAQEAGRKEGAAAADTLEAKRLAVIECGVADARRNWDDRLDGLEALAALLSRAALARIFAPDADLADLTARAITRQTEALAGETVVAIRVSTSDFGPEALAALREGSAIDVAADRTLVSGACRFDLQLGSREVGPSDQWAVLDRFLAGLAA